MDKKAFNQFCRNEFELRGFKKQKNAFYMKGKDLLCGLDMQKSNYGNYYYINYYYFIKDFKDVTTYPTYYESDIEGRIVIMSKNKNAQGRTFMTSQIEYGDYSEDELKSFFNSEFEEKILPPIYKGKKYILDNLDIIYFLTLNKEAVKKKLKNTGDGSVC